MESISLDIFEECIRKIVAISDDILDGWQLKVKEGKENGSYITKKQISCLSPEKSSKNNIVVTFEFHVAYSISYGVPILCFNVWKQDGSFLSLEDFRKYSEKLKGSNISNTLTQMEHPVLNKPILTLHPCRTHEIVQPFLGKSKNPVISWLSVVGPFVHLELSNVYYETC